MPHHDLADLKNLTTNVILQLGIPANLKGYYYIREAVVMSACEPEVLDNISGKIYTAIAQNHGVTIACIERAFATAIRTSCKRGNKEIFACIFGKQIAAEIKAGEKTIANKEYIVGLMRTVRKAYEKEAAR
ncbi:MAG: sporulation initiation factor Spo0A C-terminal domain-containing protein [Ruminococcus sp.]|nr:sporulation initiation factor Spo0A C-terminal domain-containing protein [Ruminococcus sp.]